MNARNRLVHAALAVLSAALLGYFLLGAGGERPLALIALAAVALVWFWRPQNLLHLVVLVPLGPLLDFPFLTFGRAVYATEIVLLAALFGWGVRSAWRPDDVGALDPRRTLSVALFGAFAAVGGVVLCLGHPDMLRTPEGLRGLRVLTLSLAVSSLFLRLGHSDDTRRRVVRLWTVATLAGLAAISLGGIAEFLAGVLGLGDGAHPRSFYRSSVAVGNHIAFFSPLALSLWLSPIGRRLRLACGATWFAAMACLPLTASRGAMASVAITTVLLVAVMGRQWDRKQRRLVVIVLAILVVGASMLAIRPELAGEEFAYKFRASVSGDFFSTRVDSWGDAIDAIGEHPFDGEGPAAWAPAVALELARRHGIPAALLAMAALIVAVIQVARAASRRDEIGDVVRSGDMGGAFSSERGPGPEASFKLAVRWGFAAGMLGFLLVGLAETALGARTTPLVAAAIGISGLLAWRGSDSGDA